MKILSCIGLVFAFAGILILFWYLDRTGKAFETTTKSRLVSRWWYRIGYFFLTLSFIALMIYNIL